MALRMVWINREGDGYNLGFRLGRRDLEKIKKELERGKIPFLVRMLVKGEEEKKKVAEMLETALRTLGEVEVFSVFLKQSEEGKVLLSNGIIVGHREKEPIIILYGEKNVPKKLLEIKIVDVGPHSYLAFYLPNIPKNF